MAEIDTLLPLRLRRRQIGERRGAEYDNQKTLVFQPHSGHPLSAGAAPWSSSRVAGRVTTLKVSRRIQTRSLFRAILWPNQPLNRTAHSRLRRLRPSG